MSDFGHIPNSSDTAGGVNIPVSHAFVPGTAGGVMTAVEGTEINTDGNGYKSTPLRLQSKSGDLATGAIVDLAALLTLAGSPADANTVNSLMGRLTKIRDVLNATLSISGIVTEANSAGMRTDLDTIAGAVSGNKLAAKAAASDIVDLATMLTLAGTPTDANTINSVMGRLTKIRDLLNSTLNVSVTNGNANGQATMANSAPVVLASNDAVEQAFKDTSTTGTVTNDGDVVSIALPGGQATAVVNIQMGTLAGTLLFEASFNGGATWDSVSGSQTGSSSVATSTTTGGTWRVGVAGGTNFRVRVHPVTSGASGTITLRVSQGVHNVVVINSSVLGQQIKANSAPVVIASDQIVPVNGGYVDLTTTVTGLSNGATVVGPIDVSGYTWGSFQATGTYSMSLTFQGSMTGAAGTWVNIPWTSIAQTTEQTPSVTYGAANTLYHGPLPFKYFQILVGSYVSNSSLNAACRVFANPPAMLPMQANVVTVPTTTGGTSDHHRISTADTNLVSAKATTGQVYGYDIGNNGASDAWVKLFNKASAPVIGTDTVFRTVYIPKGSARAYHNPEGIAFSTGIAYAITAGAADNDTTAVGAAQVTLELDYK